MVSGIDAVDGRFQERIVTTVSGILGVPSAQKLLNGLPMVKFPEGLESSDSGFFAILDFTELNGMKYHGHTIRTNEDLLKFFYSTSRTRFLVGQSISWPYDDELVGRISYSVEDEKLVKALFNMYNAILLLEGKDDYIIRKKL